MCWRMARCGALMGRLRRGICGGRRMRRGRRRKRETWPTRRPTLRPLDLWSDTGCDRLKNMKRRSTKTAELARVRRIYRKLRGARGIDEDELWQHALYFAKTPEERCRISLQTAHSALSLRRSGK